MFFLCVDTGTVSSASESVEDNDFQGNYTLSIITSISAVTERPRDAACRWKFC